MCAWSMATPILVEGLVWETKFEKSVGAGKGQSNNGALPLTLEPRFFRRQFLQNITPQRNNNLATPHEFTHEPISNTTRKSIPAVFFSQVQGWWGEGALGQHIAGESLVSVCDGACDAGKFQQTRRVANHSCVEEIHGL